MDGGGHRPTRSFPLAALSTSDSLRASEFDGGGGGLPPSWMPANVLLLLLLVPASCELTCLL